MLQTKFLRAFASAAGSLCIMVSGAHAATVYDNGAPNGVSGNETSAWVQAQDFKLGSTVSLTGATVNLFILGSSGLSTDVPLSYYILANSAGQPGSVLASGSANNVIIAPTGVVHDNINPIYAVKFDFATAFTAAAETTYWLGIHATNAFIRQEIYFASTSVNATQSGRESYGGSGNWSNNGQEHAFSLQGDIGSAVPEPATWAMMIIGFGAVGSMVRTSRRRNAFSAA